MAVDVTGLLALVDEWAVQVGDVCAQELENIVRDAAPVGETGELRDSVSAEASGGAPVVTVHIEASSDHASYTDEGTPPHKIEGNPLLAFDWPKAGKFMIVHSVNHPGTPAQRWFEEPMPGYLDQALDIAVAQVHVG